MPAFPKPTATETDPVASPVASSAAAAASAAQATADAAASAASAAQGTANGAASAAAGAVVLVGTKARPILPWATATAYLRGEAVTNGGAVYTANDAHTSGATFAGDQASHWTVLPGASSDASTTVKGVSKLSVAPVSAGTPIAVGDNDPRVVSTHPQFAAGRYWVNGPGAGNANSQGTEAQVCASPILIPLSCTLDRIGIYCANAGSTGAVIRLGIYAFNGGDPGALILDAGTVSVTGTGFKVITISQALDAGWYFVCAAWQGAPVTRGNINALTANLAMLGNSFVTPQDGMYSQGFVKTGVTGALPDPFAGTENQANAIPRIAVRRS